MNKKQITMNNLTLRDSILVLTLIPIILVGLILGAYFTINRYAELEEILYQQGMNIIQPLAIATEEPITNKDKVKLRKLISITHNKHAPLVKSIGVFGPDNQLILTSNFHEAFKDLHYDGDLKRLHNTTMTKVGKSLVFHAPVKHNYEIKESWDKIHANSLGVIVLELSKDQAIISQQRALLFASGIILLAVLLTTLLSLRVSRMFTAPLSRLLLATDKLAEGKKNIDLNEAMPGELELLRVGLNTINDKMNSQRDEMQKDIDQATSDYRETLEQYETQNIQLSFTKKEAQDANRVKSDFLAKMSHELRTPLNGVIGFTRQLYKTPLNKHQKDYLDTIELSANNLLTIISDILDFSKLEAGAMDLENIQFQLRDAVNEVTTLLAPSAYEKQLEFSVSINKNVPDNLIGDPTRFKQVLINLISNAIKFTENGSVKIDISHRKLKDSQTSLLISVSDTGVGIAMNKQDTLFTPFAQADSSITRKFGGTGLGLIITKHIVEAMDGKITLNSAPGNGSCFTFNAIFQIPNRRYSDDLPVKTLKNKRVLYFEPQEHTHHSVISLLTDWQMQVTPCVNEDEFEQALKSEFAYDICLIGNMGNVDHMPLLKSYVTKARESCDYLYLMLNTMSHNMRESFIGNGADACLSKPLNHRKLCDTLAAPYRLDDKSLTQENEQQTVLPLKALIADDNDANLKLLNTLLSEQIEHIDSAHNGVQAVSLCKKHNYDLIFMDIQMPIMDGISACKAIKESSLNEDTPIIAVTAHALTGEKEQLFRNGFNGYLTKPIDEDMLKQIICDHSNNLPIHTKNKIESPTVNAPFKSHLLDWQLALQHAGGKADLAIEMLNMLLQSLPDTLKTLEYEIEQSNIEKLLVVVHKFHGACCYTGVPKLKKLSETIETALKKQQPITDIEPELYELIDEMKSLITDAKLNNR